MRMKQFLFGLTLTAFMCFPAFGAPLSSNARTVVPSAMQQIISVDYRALRGNPDGDGVKESSVAGQLEAV